MELVLNYFYTSMQTNLNHLIESSRKIIVVCLVVSIVLRLCTISKLSELKKFYGSGSLRVLVNLHDIMKCFVNYKFCRLRPLESNNFVKLVGAEGLGRDEAERQNDFNETCNYASSY